MFRARALVLAALLMSLSGCAQAPAPAPAATPTATSAPVALGTVVHGAAWDVTVGSVTKNADAVVAAANEFNPKPETGTAYALVSVTITNTGTAPAAPLAVDVSFGKLASAVAPSPLHLLTPLAPGQSATGNLVFLVADSATPLTVTVADAPPVTVTAP